jgi:hypothetical protein
MKIRLNSPFTDVRNDWILVLFILKRGLIKQVVAEKSSYYLDLNRICTNPFKTLNFPGDYSI